MRLLVVDAFTSRPFSGNPAGVCLLAEPADPQWMAKVAAEMKHAETAFLHRTGDREFGLRWFTPTTEVDLCGHATLASAHVIFTEQTVPPDAGIAFHTNSGRLAARRTSSGAIALDFPAEPATPADVPGLAEALATPVEWVGRNRFDVLAELGDAASVRDLSPDPAALAAIEARGVIVTAPAAPGADHDFVSRFFAPRAGVPEDPVTGSAHCALAPYWSRRLGRDDLVGVQLSPRSGRVGTRLDGERVELTGSAVTVLDAELLA